MRAQIAGYAGAKKKMRSSQNLNKLRTLALALVSLTNFDLVTPTEEDRRYFALYEENAKIGQDQRFIQEACEILYNVQEAESQWQRGRSDQVVGYLVAGLTSLTLISVMADAYNFLSGNNEALIQERLLRLELLLVLLMIALTTLWLVIRRRRRT